MPCLSFKWHQKNNKLIHLYNQHKLIIPPSFHNGKFVIDTYKINDVSDMKMAIEKERNPQTENAKVSIQNILEDNNSVEIK